MAGYENIGNASRLPFTTRDVALMAAFFTLLMVTNVVWIAGQVIGNLTYGILVGAVWTAAAVVIGKRYTILTIGVVQTIMDLLFANMYSGAFPIADICGALVLEGILWLYSPYAGSRMLNIAAMVVYSIVTGVVFVFMMVNVVGMAMPDWLIIARVLVPVIPFAIGAFIGHGLGNRVKSVVSTI